MEKLGEKFTKLLNILIFENLNIWTKKLKYPSHLGSCLVLADW